MTVIDTHVAQGEYWWSINTGNITERGIIIQAPTASFTFSPSFPAAGQQVSFDGSGSINASTWDWHDVKTGSPIFLGSGELFNFTFQNEGEKHIRLTVSNETGSDSTMQVVDVGAEQPPEDPPTQAPTISINNVTSSSISLQWNSVQDATQYEVQRDGVTLGTTSNTSYIDSMLDSETNYGPYRVRATNIHGDGPWSNEVSATTSETGSDIPTTMQSSVEQYGLTVTFDQQYPVGQFVTGDWFVVGEPTVISTNPTWDGTLHGSMVNPVPDRQGFRAGGTPNYVSELNVGPIINNGGLQLSPGDAFIHTRGLTNSEAEALNIHIVGGQPRPGVADAMVLTCVSESPLSGSFRPAHLNGYNKQPTIYDINWSMLPGLPIPASAPALLEWGDRQTKFQVSWGPGSNARYWFPHNHMRHYQTLNAAARNTAVMQMMCDYPHADLIPAMYGTIQTAIDMYAISLWIRDNNFQWGNDGNGFWGCFGGGLGNGYHMPLWFAGQILDDSDFKAATGTFDPLMWLEHMQPYYVADREGCSDSADWQHPTWGWGERAWTRCSSSSNGIPGNAGSYTGMMTANTSSGTLIAYLLTGSADSYGNDAAVDWSYWRIETDTDGSTHGQNGPHWNQFLKDMWDTYRSQF